MGELTRKLVLYRDGEKYSVKITRGDSTSKTYHSQRWSKYLYDLYAKTEVRGFRVRPALVVIPSI